MKALGNEVVANSKLWVRFFCICRLTNLLNIPPLKPSVNGDDCPLLFHSNTFLSYRLVVSRI